MPKAYVFTRYGGPGTEEPPGGDRTGPGPGRTPAAAHGRTGRDRHGPGGGRTRCEAVTAIGAAV